MDIPDNKEIDQSLGGRIFSFIGRVLLAISIPFIAFFVLYQGFLFLRDSNASRVVIATVAIVWGVGGVALLYWIFNGLVEGLPDVWRTRFCLLSLSDRHGHPRLVSGHSNCTHFLDQFVRKGWSTKRA